MTTRMRGGGAVTRGLQAALHHREQYMSALRQHRIDDADAALRQRIGVPRMLLWRNTTTTTTTRPASPQLVLPPQWLEHATHALTHVCSDVVPSSVLRSSDYLLCALVHPTYVRPQTVRCPTRTSENSNSSSGNSNTSTTAAATAAAVATLRAQLAMPLELSLCGGAAVRILASLAQQHARAAAAREAQELVAAADEDTQSNDDDDDDDDNKQHADDTAAAAAASSTTAASSAARRRLQRQLQRQRRSAGRPLQPYVPQRVPVLDTHALATLPAVMGVAQHILYDADAFVAQHDANTSAAAPATTPSVPPHEVCVAAAVALCGAVDVTAGLSAVAALLDRALRTS